MAITNATIALSSDLIDGGINVSNMATLNTAGTDTGMNTLASVTKTLSSTNQVDLITTASVSTTHAYVYINNPNTDSTTYLTVTIGNAGAGSATDTEELGRLYGGDWMFIPWDVDDDICVTPSTAEDMTVEYMVFS
tara:strand:+ start:678 stop:1085 length:408 start_codon:yes stop_codon:yes gene_type:complete